MGDEVEEGDGCVGFEAEGVREVVCRVKLLMGR